VMANVAGIMGAGGPIPSIEEGVLDRVLAVNLKGVFFGVQAALRVMGEQGSGSIINVASAAIDAPAPNLAVYAMTKAAVAMLTRTAAVEGGPAGVRVNCVCPGLIDTPMADWIRLDPVAIAAFEQEAPAQRMGTPRDVAGAVSFLASDDAAYAHGTVLVLDGGVTA